MKKSYEFCKSNQIAIAFLTNLTNVVTNWKHFTWFHKIADGEVCELQECYENGSYFKKVKREVLFYGYKQKLIAKVFLIGNIHFNTDKSTPNFWRVVEVHYVNNYDESRIFLQPSWTEIKINEEDQVLI